MRRSEKQRYRASINAYDGLIAYIDTEVGALRGELERRGLTGSTIVILTADHGEGLGDHKQPQHGKNLHRAVARVPLIVIRTRRRPGSAGPCRGEPRASPRDPDGAPGPPGRVAVSG